MAKQKKDNSIPEDEKKLEDELVDQYPKAETAQKEVRDGGFTWNDREDLFFGRYKNSKEDTKSVLSTGELTTLAIDGACRVMAQMPTGRFHNYNNKTGANMLMNLLFEHYVAPNATTGGPLLLKFRMANLYSRVFPVIPVFIDWKVTDKYVGPDAAIIHPRRFRPQPGKTAIEDMDWCFIDTEVTKDWLKKQNIKIWKNVNLVLKAADNDGSGTPEEDRSPNEKGKTKTGITLRHRFSSNGDWVCYDPTSKKVLLNEKDYFPGIPIALKLQYPRLDSLWGITDFDRGGGTQKSIDTLIRRYLDGVDISIDPPAAMDPEDVVLSSIVRQPKAKWFVKNGKVDSIKMQNVSPKGLETFQSTYQILKGNLLSLGASTDTSVTKDIDPGFGRTPQALKMQGERMGARDAWDIFMQEQFIERVCAIMANLLAKKGVKPYAFNLLGDSIKRIKEEYPNEDYGKLLGAEFENGKAVVDNKAIEGEFRYIIDPGSILAKDDTGKRLLNYIDIYNKYPGIQEDFARNSQRFNQGEAFKRALIDEGIKDSEKIIITEQQPEAVAGVGPEGATVEQPAPIPTPEEMAMMTAAPDQPQQDLSQIYL